MSRREAAVPPVIDGRVPPHDLDAEAAVLSAALLDAEAADEVVDRLEPPHFYSEANAAIFKAIRELRSQSQPVDALTVAARLREWGLIQTIGGTAYLGRITDATPAISNVGEHADIVWRRWRRRRLIVEAQWVAAYGYDLELADDDYHDAAGARLTGALEVRHDAREAQALRDSIVSVFESLACTETPPGIVSTGLADLDRFLGGGLHPGELYVVAGVPGSGKSGLADAFEVAAATAGDWVLSHSLEMPAAQRAIRKVCSEARFDLRRVRDRDVRADDWPKLAGASQTLSSLPIHVDDTPVCSPLHVAMTARKWARKASAAGARLGLVSIDYLQIMALREGDQRALAVAEATRSLKVLARELGIPVVLLSQLNRKVADRTNKRPVPSDLKESGAIEADADAIIFVYRDEYYDPDTSDRGIAELIIAKQRNGPTGTVRVRFVGPCARFEDLVASDAHGFAEFDRGTQW